MKDGLPLKGDRKKRFNSTLAKKKDFSASMTGSQQCRHGESQLMSLLKSVKHKFLGTYITRLQVGLKKLLRFRKKCCMIQSNTHKPKICITKTIKYTSLMPVSSVYLIMFRIKQRGPILSCSIEVLFIPLPEVKLMILVPSKLAKIITKLLMLRKSGNVSFTTQKLQ